MSVPYCHRVLPTLMHCKGSACMLWLERASPTTWHEADGTTTLVSPAQGICADVAMHSHRYAIPDPASPEAGTVLLTVSRT